MNQKELKKELIDIALEEDDKELFFKIIKIYLENEEKELDKRIQEYEEK